MVWFKRIGLFLLTNLLVVLTISFLLHLFGVGRYLTAYGLDLQQLALFCLIWGMGGAFVSLAISRWVAKFAMGVKVIDPNTSDPTLQWLVQTVYHLARSSGLPAMPEVGIYDSPEVNAFATGPTKSRALVAVSTGLLRNMRREEVEGVLGHEVAHVANGDMVTLTLIQGVVNAFVMFLARVIAYALTMAGQSRDGESREGGSPMAMWLTTMVLEMVFGLLGMMVVAWFSRWREFRADAGGARLAGRQSMINALRRLQAATPLLQTTDEGQPAMAAFKISSRPNRFVALFSTHPPLEERIARLQATGA